MTDRELLEMAAKAAGISIFFSVEWHDVGECYTGSRAVPRSWNPLTDDGDAFRLAVQLGILGSPEIASHKAIVQFLHGYDMYRLERYAITLAAADIGRAMP